MADLENEQYLGLHLAAGSADGFLISAKYIFDSTNSTSVQETLDKKKDEEEVVYVKGPLEVDTTKGDGITINYTYGENNTPGTINIPVYSGTKPGLIPVSPSTDKINFLSGDGTWMQISISSTTEDSSINLEKNLPLTLSFTNPETQKVESVSIPLPAATLLTAGIMTSEDKQKLDNLSNPDLSSYVVGPLELNEGSTKLYIQYTQNNISQVVSIPTFTAATSETDGKIGLVPKPKKGEESGYLKGDGTWGIIESIDEETINALS